MSACGSDSDDAPAVDPDAPVLDAIGDRTINQGDSFGFIISASDQNDEDGLKFTVSAVNDSAYPGDDTENPATLGEDEEDARSAFFSWTPNSTTSGEYTLEFTVTDDSEKTLSDSETITISVVSTVAQGRAIYQTSCGSCHGFEGTTGSSGFELPGSTDGYTVTNMSKAIADNSNMGVNITTENFPDSTLSLIYDYFCSLNPNLPACDLEVEFFN